MTTHNRVEQILAVGLTMFLLAWISVGLRIYVRTFIIKAFGRDDIAMLVTVFFFTAFLSCEFGGLRYGTGRMRADLTDANAQTALRYWFFCEIFYTLATSALKIAVGLFLMRVAVARTHVFIIRAIMVCSAVLGIVYCCIMLFQCQPISYWWDLNPNHHGKCISPKVVIDATYVVSALNSCADWVFGTLPIFIVKDLQMKKQQKIIVALILGFAAIGSMATIVRIPYLWTMEQYKAEFLWRTSDIVIWTTTEVGVGITAGCMVTLRPLLRQFTGESTLDPSSKASWPTQSRRYKLRGRGYQGHAGVDEIMDEEQFAGHDTVNLTTVTARRASSESSRFERSRSDSKAEILSSEPRGGEVEVVSSMPWSNGINKKMTVTHTVERKNSDDEDGPKKPGNIYGRRY